MESATPGPLQVFISYSHKDEELRQEFVKHLRQLKRDGLIEDWHDREITAGSEWEGRIDQHLNAADIIVLLISPDFVASEYCYGIEMKRALERHAAGKARVVPVILRPSDWLTSPFAKLNALPKDALPVVDWPTQDPKLHDHGFLNVVEGLRRVARELRGPARRGVLLAPLPRVERPVVRATRLLPLVAAGGLIVLAIATAWFGWAWRQHSARERQYVAQGDACLNVGRYDDARELYNQALRLNTGNAAASMGAGIANLAARLKTDPVNFEQQLNQMIQESPADAHLRVLQGDYSLGLGQLDDAMSGYQEAAKLDPNLALAYFSMGSLYDQRHDIAHALPMYKRAVELAPSSPQYACNLANQYFKQGEYDDAIRIYGNIRQFPLAALESAKIYRLKGDLKAAGALEHTAIDRMDAPGTKAPENKLPWSIEAGGAQPVSLVIGTARLCYAHLELSATLYLEGDEARAKVQSDRAVKDCGPRLDVVKAIVRWELQRVAGERSELAARAAMYSRKVLTE
jgi:tetratricopeptide (TPR) repeat protein